MSDPITIERVADFDAVSADDWNQLARRGPTGTVFQTLQWHRAWWQVYAEGAELLLLLARAGGELVGALALCLGTDRHLRFVGHGRSDYVDVIGDPPETVRRALWQQALALAPSWRRLHLRHLPEESPTLPDLRALGLRWLLDQRVPCPCLQVHNPGDLDAALGKQSVRRHHRWFARQPRAAVQHLSRADEIGPQLDAFFDQHVRRWAQTPHPSLFGDDRNRRFYRALTTQLDDTGWLCFTRLAIDGQPCAFHFGFRFGGRLVWYKPSFEIELARRSPGEALLAELLSLVGRERLTELDFTVGDEAFKSRFANHVRHNLELTVFRSGADRLCTLATRRVKAAARALLRR